MVSLTPQLLCNLNFDRHLRLCFCPSLSYTLFYIHFIATTGGAGGIGVADCVGTTAGSKYQGNFNLPCLSHHSASWPTQQSHDFVLHSTLSFDH